jgi:hypothetical protein
MLKRDSAIAAIDPMNSVTIMVALATISEFMSARPTWPWPSTSGYRPHCASFGHRSGVRV